jgi:hypothetical protein
LTTCLSRILQVALRYANVLVYTRLYLLFTAEYAVRHFLSVSVDQVWWDDVADEPAMELSNATSHPRFCQTRQDL